MEVLLALYLILKGCYLLTIKRVAGIWRQASLRERSYSSWDWRMWSRSCGPDAGVDSGLCFRTLSRVTKCRPAKEPIQCLSRNPLFASKQTSFLWTSDFYYQPRQSSKWCQNDLC